MDFTKLSRLLLPNVVEGVLKSKRYSHARVTEKLSDLQFSTKSIQQTKDDLIIELQILDDELLFNLLSGEANNFLLASRLSFSRAFQMQESNAAWQAVEHYYAAYYAIHYLLRITGISLTNLDLNATNIILKNQFSSIKVNSIPSGLYTLRYDEKFKIITLNKKLNKKSGGSHKDAWQLWIEIVEKLQLNTKVDPIEYLKESINLLDHKNFVIKSVDKYNPPDIRGEINYQFIGGSWIFEKNSNKSIHKIQNTISNSNLSILNSKIKLEAMIANNIVIINLAKTLFLHSANSYPESICSSLAHKYKTHIG